MSDEQSSSFVRFVTPLVLAALGIAIIVTLPGSLAETAGFALFTVGVLTFTLIYNHSRNPLATDNVVINVSQAFVVYGGILTTLVFEGVFTVSTMIIAVSVVTILGVATSAIIEISGVETSEL